MPRGIAKDRALIEELTKAHFLATDEQVRLLAGRYATGLQAQDSVKGCYLRVLTAATIKAAKPAKGKPSEIMAHLDAVHESYYAIVMKGVTTPDIADDESLDQEQRTMRSLERNRRSNFARSAKTALTNYLKAGGDLFQLDPDTLTKRELQAFVTAMRNKEAEPKTLKHRAELAVSRIEEMCRELADEDKEAAMVTVQELMARMTNFMAEMGRDATTKTIVAVKEHRPLRLREGMFWPMSKAIAPSAVQ
jgi:hypothetical protein